MKSYAMITGATGGLGKALAAECASRGWDLYLTDLHEGRLTRVALGLERLYNVDVRTHLCDLADPQSRNALWTDVANRGMRFHFQANVAGVDFEGPFMERQVDDLRSILRVNVEGTVEMIWHVLAHRDPTRTLRIVNVSSLAGYYPMPLKATYAASKRFLLDMSIALNAELRDDDISVTALCPAGMPTTPDVIEKIEAQGFMGRITTMNVGDVARRTVTMALRGRAVYVPGGASQTLKVLGGLVPASLVASFIGRRWAGRREDADGGGKAAPSLPTLSSVTPSPLITQAPSTRPKWYLNMRELTILHSGVRR